VACTALGKKEVSLGGAESRSILKSRGGVGGYIEKKTEDYPKSKKTGRWRRRYGRRLAIPSEVLLPQGDEKMARRAELGGELRDTSRISFLLSSGGIDSAESKAGHIKKK